MSNIVRTVTDTKFRRETSNFKFVMEFDTDAQSYVYIPDPNSENPTEVIQGLLQILPKNLGWEDFIGMIVIAGNNTIGKESVEPILRVGVEPYNDTYTIRLEAWNNGYWYWPDTGYLTDDTYDPTTGTTGDIMEEVP